MNSKVNEDDEFSLLEVCIYVRCPEDLWDVDAMDATARPLFIMMFLI